jgi:hypothetical protein
MSAFIEMHQAARGLYRVEVVDARTKEVVWAQKDWGRNMILNNGMDHVATTVWCECFTYGIAGTGVTPTNRISSEVTADQSGTAVTATVGSFTFTSGDIANMIKWDSGQEARITGYTSGQSVTVTTSQSVPSGPFTVYHTNQTGLTAEVKRSINYLTGAPYTQNSIDLPTATLKNRRTYDFTVESGTVNYTEVGVGWASTGGSTTFSRILLPSAIPVGSGQQLRLVYELQITLAPSTAQALSAAVSGWPVAPSVNTDATQQIQVPGLSLVHTNGVTITATGGMANEPSRYANNCHVFCSANSTAFAAFNTSVSRNTAGWGSAVTVLSAYVPLSFMLDKTGTIIVSAGNMTNIRTIGIGDYAWNGNQDPVTYPPFVVLFAQDQTKANTQTLTLTFRSSWSRTLS